MLGARITGRDRRRPMLLPLVFGVVLVLVGVTASALVAVASDHLANATLGGVVNRDATLVELFVNGEPYHVAPDQAHEVDETGAGDVFATVLLIEYDRTGDPWEAAAVAACAGAASVEGPGAFAVPDRAGLTARLTAYRKRRGG